MSMDVFGNELGFFSDNSLVHRPNLKRMPIDYSVTRASFEFYCATMRFGDGILCRLTRFSRRVLCSLYRLRLIFPQ